MFPCSDEALLFGLSFAVLPQKVCHVQSCKFIAALISENNVTVFTRLDKYRSKILNFLLYALHFRLFTVTISFTEILR